MRLNCSINSTIITQLSDPRESFTNLSHGYDRILSKYPVYQASLALYHYVLPCIIVLGTVSNALSFVVMTRKKLRDNSTCMFLAVLAVFDTLVLYVSGARYWFGKMTTVDIKLLNNPMCKLFGGFLYNFVRHVSVWIVIAVTVDRFMLIAFPVKTRKIHPRRRVKIGLAVIMGFFFILDATTFWTYELIEDCVFKNGAEGQMTTQVRCYTHVLRSAWSWVDLCSYSFIPITLLLGLNVRLMIAIVNRDKNKKLAEAKQPNVCAQKAVLDTTPESSDSAVGLLGKIPPRQNRRDETASRHCETQVDRQTQNHRPNERKDRRNKCEKTKKLIFSNLSNYHWGKGEHKNKSHSTTFLPLIVSVSFIICATPITVIEILYAKNNEMGAAEAANVRLIRTIFFMLMYLNHSVNLFLYCIAGTTFRRELIDVFRRCCRC